MSLVKSQVPQLSLALHLIVRVVDLKSNIFQNTCVAEYLRMTKWQLWWGAKLQFIATLIILVAPATANTSPSLSNSMLNTTLQATLGSLTTTLANPDSCCKFAEKVCSCVSCSSCVASSESDANIILKTLIGPGTFSLPAVQCQDVAALLVLWANRI